MMINERGQNMNLSPRKKLFVDTATEMFGAGAVLTKANTKEAAAKAGVPSPSWFRKSCKVGYNEYKLPNGEPVETGEQSYTCAECTSAHINRKNDNIPDELVVVHKEHLEKIEKVEWWK